MLLNDWLAYFLFFAKPELVSHIIREPIIVKLLKSEIWFDERIIAQSAYMSGKFYFKKGTVHSFTNPSVCPTRAILSHPKISILAFEYLSDKLIRFLYFVRIT